MTQRQTPRSAIVGAGMVGAVHAHAVRRAGGQLAAIAASTPHTSALAAVRLGAERPPHPTRSSPPPTSTSCISARPTIFTSSKPWLL